MCGIVAAAAGNNIVPVLVEGLKKLEYRGYDSAGLAVIAGNNIERVRSVGRVAELEAASANTQSVTGIAHTRWATHGVPSERNAHPHVSGSIAVVHNGIIENYESLRRDLTAQGYVFTSDTDTESIAHLLEATSNNSVDSGGVNVDAYNRDKSRVFGLQLRNRLGTGWNSTLRLGLGEDNSSNFAPARTQFATQQKQLTWQHDIRVGAGSLMLALENLDQSVTSTTNYGIKDRTVRSLIAGYQGSVGRHSWQAALRHDDNSQFGGHRTGSLAYGYRFAERWQARVAEGTAFKAPSFNQLYFPGFGNAGLQPEKARNREFALHWEEGTRSASLTHFDNRIDNLIAGSPAVNIGKARITGASLAGSLAAGAWTANAGLDLMKPVDASNGNRLQRRPAEMLKLAIAYAGARWRGGVELSAIGRRYDTTTQGRIMGGYSASNLYAAYELDRDWTLEGRINNLFDRVYENAWSYAVPDRQLFVGLRYAPQ